MLTRTSYIRDEKLIFGSAHLQATQEEIVAAYRRQSKLYHPDKHLDPERKQEADVLFNRTKKAYEGEIAVHKKLYFFALTT